MSATPDSPSPCELIDLARRTMEAAKFPQLATIDGDQPRVRPVSPVKTEGFVVHVANLRAYAKTAQIESNPRVELCYLAPNHDQVRITGRALIESDPSVLQSIWDGNALLRKYLGSPDNPDLIVYRIEPKAVRYMREWALHYHDVPLST